MHGQEIWVASQSHEKQEGTPVVVTAHEIGTFVFCPEQWRLEYGLGLEPSNQAAIKSGSRHHARNEAIVGAAGKLLWTGQNAISAALILLFVLWIIGR
jgi:hypothetical protein